MEAFEPRNAETRTWAIIGAVEEVAKSRGVSMAQVALAWTAAQPAVTSVILGARTRAQLADNLGAADVVLSAAEIATLSAVSTPQVSDYPYGTAGRQQRSRAIAGGR